MCRKIIFTANENGFKNKFWPVSYKLTVYNNKTEFQTHKPSYT